MVDQLPTHWIDSAQGLETVRQSIQAAGSVALDTESNSGFRYRERLCLLQLNDGSTIWLIDLLAIPGEQAALDPLRSSLESADFPKVLHGGEFDVGCLKRDFGIGLTGVWDTQQAAAFLGWDKTSYGALVERVLGVSLPKAHTRYDWSRRPVDPEALEYAIHDVLYLPGMAEELRTEVQRAEIVDEVEIACRAVEQATWNGGYKPAGLWSIKGARKLSEEQQGVLMSLYGWRERLARELDLPPGRALNNEILLALARNCPVRPDELKRIGLPRRVGGDRAGDLLRLISEARNHPPELPPQPVKKPMDRQMRLRSDHLKAWRRTEAERRGVPLQVVLPVAAMRYLTQHGADDLDAVPQLGDKRIRLYGETLQQLLATPT